MKIEVDKGEHVLIQIPDEDYSSASITVECRGSNRGVCCIVFEHGRVIGFVSYNADGTSTNLGRDDLKGVTP